jgi:hypothetical protein
MKDRTVKSVQCGGTCGREEGEEGDEGESIWWMDFIYS